MNAFRKTLADFEVDGIWLDYHHSHVSWEQADPNLPDTCFCARCLRRFQEETNTVLPDAPVSQVAQHLLGPLRAAWTVWRCAVFTDWVQEFRDIRDTVRPAALLGTFHCPWTAAERDGGLRGKLALDLRGQRPFIDVFSPMLYHARFGHGRDIEWISRQVAWLAGFLDITGYGAAPLLPGAKRIWPIVQLSDWGEPVHAEDVLSVLRAGTQWPATGITVFNWASLQNQPEKVQALIAFYESRVSSPDFSND